MTTRTRRLAVFPALALALPVLAASAVPALAQETVRPVAGGAAQRIADAMAAAPASIARDATIKDWPSAPGGDLVVLRQGTNGWVCLPTPPSSSRLLRDPMCIDGEWQRWLSAYLRKEAPRLTGVGYSYMLASDAEGSNTDPFATQATPDNHWHKVGPHVMVVYPDARMYEALSTDPASGGPYVMWKGTPYAHVMWPTPR